MELKKKTPLRKQKGIRTRNGVKLYKVVRVDGTPNQQRNKRFLYSLPNGNKPGDWKTVKGELYMCSNGLHLTTNPANWIRFLDDRVFEAEYRGEMKNDYSDKICCRSVRLLRELAVVNRSGHLSFRPFTKREKIQHRKKVKNSKLIKRLNDQIDKKQDEIYAERNQKETALIKAHDAALRRLYRQTTIKIRRSNSALKAQMVKLGANRNGTLNLRINKNGASKR